MASSAAAATERWTTKSRSDVTPDDLREAIGRGHQKKRRKDDPREYIGASGIGSPCDAYLEFCLRGFPDNELDGKLLRIFELGHKIEDIVVADLKLAGLWVAEKNPDTNYQWAYSELGGHVKAHADGLCTLGAEHDQIMLLEIKSMNKASWNKFEKHGVKSSHPKYYDQMQLLMAMAKVERCLFVAYNKDDSNYHHEIVESDPIQQGFLIQRIERVISEGGEKISDNPDDWRCASCFKSEVCWQGKEPTKKCPTCKHSRPREDGQWDCSLTGGLAVKPCESYEVFKPKPKGGSS